MHSDGLFQMFPNQFRFVGESRGGAEQCPPTPPQRGAAPTEPWLDLCFSSPPGNAQNTLAQPTVWLTIALTTVVCIMPVVAFRFLKLDLKPELSDTVRARGHSGVDTRGPVPWGAGGSAGP